MSKCGKVESYKDLAALFTKLVSEIGNDQAKNLAVKKLYKTVATNITLDTYFEPNTKSTSKLTKKADIKIVTKLQTDIEDFIKNELPYNSTDSNGNYYDSFIIPYGTNSSVTAGFQSLLATLYNSSDKNVGVAEKEDGYVQSDELFPKEVTNAVAIAMSDWIANDLRPSLEENRSDDEIRSMLGMDRKAPVTSEDREKLAGIDVFYNSAANAIGAKAYKLLGIKPRKDVDASNNKFLEAKFKTELGMLAMETFKRKGRFAEVTKSMDTKTDGEVEARGIQVSNKFRKVLLDRENSIFDKKTLGKLYEDTLNENKKQGVYSSAEEATPDRREIVNHGVTGLLDGSVSEEQKDAIIKQSSTPYKLKKGFINVVRKLNDNNKELLEKLLGKGDPTHVIDILKAPITGRNNAIEDSINYLLDANEEFGTDKEMFAKWVVITSGRFMIDSNKLNWQDKKLHRNAVYATESKIEVTKENVNGFKLAVGQALGVDIDKNTARTLLEGKDSLVDKQMIKFTDAYDVEGLADTTYETLEEYEDSDLFIEHVETLINYAFDEEINLGEPEHLLTGITELLRYSFASVKGLSFKTQITAETDAITSGYGIKMMQIPILYGENIEKQLKEFEKVGMFQVTEDKKNPSYGQRVEDEIPDSYEEPAKEVSKILNSDGYKIPKEILKLIDPKVKIDKQDNIHISRAFMKNPFMVLNYGSAIRSIIASTAKIAENNLYKLVNDVYTTEELELRKELMRILKVIGGPIPHGKEALRKFKLTDTQSENLQNFIIAKNAKAKTVGSALEEVLTEKYKPFIELTRTVNELFTFQFKVAKKMLDKRIEELYESKVQKLIDKGMIRVEAMRLVPPIKEAEIKDLINGLRMVFPVINSVLKGSKILIAKKAKVQMTTDNIDPQAMGNINGPGVRTRTRMKYGSAEIYKLVEAYSSGSVVPIHFFDGSVQSMVLKKYTALGVHDANYFNINQLINGTKYYNEEWLKLNEQYHLLGEILQSTLNTINSATNNKTDKFDPIGEVTAEMSASSNQKKYDYLKDTIIPQIEKLAEVEELSENNREKIFAKKLSVQHAYAEQLDENGNVESAAYVHDGNKYEKKITSKESIDKGIKNLLGAPANTSKKSSSADAMHKNGNMIARELSEKDSEKC